MSVNDAEPGDIYVDAQSKLWRIIGICHEPTVIAEEVEGTLHDPNAMGHLVNEPPSVSMLLSQASIVKTRKTGGVGGLMWDGWKRIWRNDWKSKQPATFHEYIPPKDF